MPQTVGEQRFCAPNAASGKWHARWGLTERVEDIRQNLFLPNGGLRGLASARSIGDSVAEVERVLEKGALSAALQVIYVARMHFQPVKKVKASLMRARSLLQETYWDGGNIRDVRHHADTFKEWGDTPLFGLG
jgi:hypothetical protein